MADTLSGKNHREVLYCPEEEDWEAYAKYHDVNYDWGDILAIRREKKKAGLWTPCKKKPSPPPNPSCLIYNHQFTKIPNFSSTVYNTNYTTREPSPKKILTRVEESYWSKWKPNKKQPEEPVQVLKIPTNQPEDTEFHSEEDPGQQLIAYFANKGNFSTSTVTGSDLNVQPSRTKGKKNSAVFPLILGETKSVKEGSKTGSKASSTLATNRTYSVHSDKTKDQKATLEQQPSHFSITPDGDENGSTTRLKTLRHIDSLILNKKKQAEPKQHYVQPKCIKLFKKKPKGGSYPLGSQSKSQSAKSSFRLGAPGSPILIRGDSLAGSGLLKKSKKLV